METELTQEQIDNLKGWKTELLRRLCKSELEIKSLKETLELVREDNKFLQNQNKSYREEIYRLRKELEECQI